MKTNFEKVKAICNSGKIALIETKGGYEDEKFLAITKSPSGLFRKSEGRYANEALEGYHGVYMAEGEINDLCISSITPINYPPHNIKVGDKVRILECARELEDFEDWDCEQVEFIGKTCTVGRVFNDTYGDTFDVFNDKYEVYQFPLSCVCLDWED